MNVSLSGWRRLIRLGFRLLYNEFAFTYDWVSRFVSLGQWKCWQRSVFEFVGDDAGQSILEIAHGTGDLQFDLHSRGLRAAGVDLSPNMGKIAQRKLRRAGIRARLARCQAQALPFADAQFDVVICTFPTPFIFEDATLREVRRVLRTEGRLVVVLTGVFTTRGLHIRVLEWLYRVTGQREGTADADRVYQPLLEKVTAFGFEPRMERVPCRYSEAHVLIAAPL
jgi:ubiquinone/menaquinone biosynthesis C-methylase UbiE